MSQLIVGERLGPYEILAPIGAGGMGEVYRARDQRLGRDVAVKISAQQFTERFEREARAIAALNHPNVCQLYDVGPNYLVMELVEGETLAERIKSGPIPLEEALKIARQIADALEAAHNKGITHRDLKPGNIKLTHDGTVKVLDFGLAKVTADSSGPVSQDSPTISMAATQAGVILGTAAYMSPEQAKGKPVDKRADIWSYGVVVYEMVTGRQPFQREDVTETLASVIMQQPDLTPVPARLQKLLKRCLEKDPAKRLRDISGMELLLEEAPEAAAAAPVSSRIGFSWVPWTLAGLLAVALAGGTAWHFRQSNPANITRFSISLPEGQQFSVNTNRSYLNLSPDGTKLVYTANQRLYLRPMGELTARPIAGTDVGLAPATPVFSPDGSSLAFYFNTDRTLKRIAVAGGAPVTICAVAGAPRGLSWSPEGLVFAINNTIYRVSPNGGKPEALVTGKEDEQFSQAQMLPGSKAVLFSAAKNNDWEKAHIDVQTLASGARKNLIEVGTDGRYVSSGHLVYAIGGVLFAVPFNLGRLEVTGGQVPVVEGVDRFNNTGVAQFSFSENGSLVYVPGPARASGANYTSQLVLLDRKGQVESLKTKLAVPSNTFPRVSRDGKKVAYQTDDGKESAIWIYELSGAHAPNRLTLPGTGSNKYPVWSPDGERVTFQSDREGDEGIWWQRADGTGAAERLTKAEKGVAHIPDSWSPDGQNLSFTSSKGANSGISIFSVRDKKTVPLVEGAIQAASSVFSPDGKWLAYHIAAGNDGSFYVHPFPPTGAKYQSPRDGDSHGPVWSPDGNQIFYIPGNGRFASVRVNTRPSVAFGAPTPEKRPPSINMGSANFPRNFDLFPDGNHFVVVFQGDQTGGNGGAQMQVVLNWFEDVKQRAPSK